MGLMQKLNRKSKWSLGIGAGIVAAVLLAGEKAGENIYLYNIDDLHSIIKENYKSREEEALKAEVIVQEEVQKFLKKFS